MGLRAGRPGKAVLRLEQRRAAQLAADDDPLPRVHQPVAALHRDRGSHVWSIRADRLRRLLSRSAALHLASAAKVAARCACRPAAVRLWLQNFDASSEAAVSLEYLAANPSGRAGIEPGMAPVHDAVLRSHEVADLPVNVIGPGSGRFIRSESVRSPR